MNPLDELNDAAKEAGVFSDFNAFLIPEPIQLTVGEAAAACAALSFFIQTMQQAPRSQVDRVAEDNATTLLGKVEKMCGIINRG